jgi:hypothetical protein
MQNFFFICRSVTYAQKTAKILEHAGIPAVVTRTPKMVTTEGCSFCVRVTQRNFTDALIAVNSAGLPPARVFTQYEDGDFSEVGL